MLSPVPDELHTHCRRIHDPHNRIRRYNPRPRIDPQYQSCFSFFQKSPFYPPRQLRFPNNAVPMRTIVAPSSNATSKSLDIPIDNVSI